MLMIMKRDITWHVLHEMNYEQCYLYFNYYLLINLYNIIVKEISHISQ